MLVPPVPSREINMSTLAKASVPKPKPTDRVKGSGRKSSVLNTSLSIEERRMLISDHPITFEEWLDRGGKEFYELVRGSLVEKMAANIEHELLFSWLFQLIGVYVQHVRLGKVLGSRTG